MKYWYEVEKARTPKDIDRWWVLKCSSTRIGKDVVAAFDTKAEAQAEADRLNQEIKGEKR